MKILTKIGYSCFLAVLSVVLVMSLTGAGNKFYLSQYQEECYQYVNEAYVANWTFQKYSEGCFSIGGYLKRCELINITYFYNSTRFTDKCNKYHLVRLAD